jgi:hypothetical protein
VRQPTPAGTYTVHLGVASAPPCVVARVDPDAGPPPVRDFYDCQFGNPFWPVEPGAACALGPGSAFARVAQSFDLPATGSVVVPIDLQ